MEIDSASSWTLKAACSLAAPIIYTGRACSFWATTGRPTSTRSTPPADPRSIGPPTPVPSMQGRRMVSVAANDSHCLALSREGEVYSWGDGFYGALGHADGGERTVPIRIESLSRIESITAGSNRTSAAVDEDGRLFTWGRAESNKNEPHEDEYLPSGLGYALESQAESQPTPKLVDALSGDRVVGVSIGWCFTLAVSDAGAVFSFGHSESGALGHGKTPFEKSAEVLPRRIEALAQTGRRFVTVATGAHHAFALNEEGELYGWGLGRTNGHGRDEPTLQQLNAFDDQRIKHVVAAASISACAVTEKDEVYTWGDRRRGELGHGNDFLETRPKRVEGLNGVKVAAVAICSNHTLVADDHGVVWAFGQRSALGLGDPDEDEDDSDADTNREVRWKPAPLPTLRVRACKSPDVVPFR